MYDFINDIGKFLITLPFKLFLAFCIWYGWVWLDKFVW